MDPPRPVHGCYWVPVRDTSAGPLRGCLLRYAFKCLEPLPTGCGAPLPPPDRRPGCAFISVHDDSGCIVDFECEPGLLARLPTSSQPPSFFTFLNCLSPT